MDRLAVAGGAPPTTGAPATGTPLPVTAAAPPGAPLPPPGAAGGGVVIGQPIAWRPILPPEITRKIKKWQCVNFGLTLLQLTASIAVISIIANQLQVVSIAADAGAGATSGKWSYACYLATTEHPQTCQYAYSVASVSIFAGFVVSLFQCLTLDCCGMGRVAESVFDLLAACWWLAGASTVTQRATEADAYGLPGSGWRQAVVALCWVAAFAFLALFVVNVILTRKLGLAFKEVQAQAAAAAASGALGPVPGGGGGGAYVVEMGGPAGAGGGAAAGLPSGYPPAPPAAGLPSGYPAAK